MCGIVGYVGKRSAQDVLLDGLEKLEYRGYDSAGVALALDGGICVVKSKGRLTALREKLAAQQLAQSFCGIGHTRWATHGEPSDVNSHPHSTPRVSIVHNGIIENYGLLKERLAAKGYTFQSETDTEVLVKLIDSCYTGDPLRALQQALAKVRGSYALAVLFFDYPDTIFAVKRESPLIVGWGEGENFVASDIPALLKYTRRYSVLEEGDMAVCTAEGIRFYKTADTAVSYTLLCWTGGYGICGTGVTSEEITLANGMKVWQHTEEDTENGTMGMADIFFEDVPGSYVASPSDTMTTEVWNANRDALLSILGTAQIGRKSVSQQAAIDAAKAQYTGEYDQVYATYDVTSGAWTVSFSKSAAGAKTDRLVVDAAGKVMAAGK